MRRNKLFLLLIMTMLCFSFVSCKRNNNDDDNPIEEEKKVGIKVSEAVSKLEDESNFQVSALITVKSDNILNFENKTIKLNVKYTENVSSINIDFNENSYNLFIDYTPDEDSDVCSDPLIIFDYSQFNDGDSGYKYVSATFSELYELIKSLIPGASEPSDDDGQNEDDTINDDEQTPEIDQKLMYALVNFADFFTSIKDDYFDENNKEGYYEFNEKGKKVLKVLINNLVEGINSQTGKEIDLDKIVSYDIETTVKTNDLNLENINTKITLESLDEASKGEIVVIDSSIDFKEYGKITVSLPENVKPLSEIINDLTPDKPNL